MFEPQKIFIGLVDFFSIFLPGALLAYLGRHRAVQIFAGPTGSYNLDTNEHLIVFLFASYLIGHLVFLLGSFIDELVYDRFRRATRLGQIARLANGEELYPYWVRRLAESHFFFGRNADAAVTKALRLKTTSLQAQSSATAINVYQWCRALLSKQHPNGLVAVERYEADSKFFRSFVIALLIMAPAYALKPKPSWTAVFACLVLVPPALLRYIDQRFKGTQNAYWLVLTLEGLNEATKSATDQQTKPAASKRDGPSHAGSVVFRENEKEPIEYLLVESPDKREWVLPKGQIEAGENMRETAVRIVLEETGCWARVDQWIADVNLPVGEAGPSTRVFLMEFLEQAEERSRNDDRQCCWRTNAEAMELPVFNFAKKVIAKQTAD